MPRSRHTPLLRRTLPLMAAIPVVVFAVLLLPADKGDAQQPEPSRDSSQEQLETETSNEASAKSARA